MRYIREREARLGEESVEAPAGTGAQQSTEGQEEGKKAPVAQKVCVLRGGFQKWQEAHGPNEQLTEAYVKDLWEDY